MFDWLVSAFCLTDECKKNIEIKKVVDDVVNDDNNELYSFDEIKNMTKQQQQNLLNELKNISLNNQIAQNKINEIEQIYINNENISNIPFFLLGFLFGLIGYHYV
jgi:ribonuclease HII